MCGRYTLTQVGPRLVGERFELGEAAIEPATLGRFKGIAEIFGVRVTGFLGWFATRTYHLYQLPLLTRKIRVVTDWTVSLFFRRDIAELGSLGHPRRIP